MKILGISGGQPNGSNDAMCKEALMGAKEMGAEVEFVRLLDLDLQCCKGCVACVMSLMSGRGNGCVLKDDFDWLLDKMLDADGILFTNPVFEKGAPAVFHIIMDRFGPRTDRGHSIIATEIAEKTGGTKPDPRFLQDKVISYVGIGGSDWTQRIACDHAIHAMSPAWTIIDNEVFPWSKGIIMEDEKVARMREIGQNLTAAAKDIPNAAYQGKKGVCPHCNSNNFYHDLESGDVICCLCGIVGEMAVKDDKMVFTYPPEQLEYAHDTPSGKAIHAEAVKKNEETITAYKKDPEFKARVDRYKAFIQPSRPE